MPLFQTANFPHAGQTNGSWALWRIEESEEQLLELLHHPQFSREELQQIRVPQRRLEWLACRLALQSLMSEQPAPDGALLKLQKNALGKPFLSGGNWQVSLSHAFPYAAAAMHPLRPVGIDVEQPRLQLLRIRHKFLSEEEQAWAGDDLQQLCLFWAAKEALYKLWGQPGLVFARDMQLAPLAEAGKLQAKLRGKAYDIHYQWHENLLLCVAL